MARCVLPLEHGRTRWVWIVAFASFWANFCLLGVHRSSAVVFVALVENFDIGREDAAWPSAIFGCFMSLTGVVTAFLSHHFSNRSIMMIGAAVASMSVSLCCFAPSIEYVALLYGACQGAGMGAVVPLTHVTINQCFLKHRALAMGIAYAGSSAGSFLFPSLAQKMLEVYGLPSTFLLLGGIMLHSLLGIALLRTPNIKASTTDDSKLKTNGYLSDNSKLLETNPKCKPEENTLMVNREGNWESKITSEMKIGKNTGTSKISDIKTLKDTSTGNQYGGLNRANRIKASLALTRMVLTNTTFILVSATFSVYFSISAIFLMVILDFVQGLDMTKSFGVFLVSAFSLGDLAGRLVCGWIGDIRNISRSTFVRCNLVCMSVLLISFPWLPTQVALITGSIFLGLLNGCIIVNYSALLAECLGMQKLALTVGFSSCIVGLTAFLRPVVIGYFRDMQKNYNFLFVSLGIVQIIVTILWLFESERTKLRLKRYVEKISSVEQS